MTVANSPEYGSNKKEPSSINTNDEDEDLLRRINYGPTTSKDLQILDKEFGLSGPPGRDGNNSQWEEMVDKAILADLSHAVYGTKKWRETDLYTKAQGRYAEDLRRTALYLDKNEEAVINNIASHVVFTAHEVSKQQPTDSATESLCELFDLAINFILFVALKFLQHYDDEKPMTDSIFQRFLDIHPVYRHGKGLIFQPNSPYSHQFLMAIFSFVTTCDGPNPYSGGDALHRYIGSRKMFGIKKEHSLKTEILRNLSLMALLKERKDLQLSGPLDEVTASYILSGPFKLEMSDHIQDHLTFQLDGRVILYNINHFDYMVLYRNCLAEYVSNVLV